MIKVAENALDAIGKYLTEHPSLATGLAAGGVGATLGALYPSEDEDETTGQRIQRRLKNALLLGGLSGGAGALLHHGLTTMDKAIPASLPTPENKIKDTYSSIVNPVTTAVTGGVVGGVGGSYLRNKAQKNLPEALRQIDNNVKKVTKLPVHALGDKVTMSEARAHLPEALKMLQGADGKLPAEVLQALHNQFGTAGDEMELLRKLQRYGISTSALEKNVKSDLYEKLTKPVLKVVKNDAGEVVMQNGKPVMEEVGRRRQTLYQLGKFLRRNKWTAGGAALLGLLAGGTHLAMGD